MTGVDATLSTLLTTGGDGRIAIDAQTGRNIYGRMPLLHRATLSFGSSTASTVSEDAAQHLRTWLQGLAQGHENYDCAAQSLRRRMVSLLGMPVEVVLAASGTDAHLLATDFWAKVDERPMIVVTATGSETGSGVALAATGRHFADMTAGGFKVARGDGAVTCASIRHATYQMRGADGRPVNGNAVAGELENILQTARSQRLTCVLVITAVSKTGLISPPIDVVRHLETAYHDTIRVIVDASQFRGSVAEYLAHGWPVIITGSKFLGGPAFSGAILCPARVGFLWEKVSLSPGMGAYIGQGDVPARWASRACLPSRNNWGLLARWEAAVFEWDRWARLDPIVVKAVSSQFAAFVHRRLSDDPFFEPLSTAGECSRETETLFPLLLRRIDPTSGDLIYMTVQETINVFQALQAEDRDGLRIELGQPVLCGERDGHPIAALRLALSARQTVAACNSAQGIETLIVQAKRAFDILRAAICQVPCPSPG